MTNTIEKVARAIYESNGYTHWGESKQLLSLEEKLEDNRVHDLYRKYAKAAIAAHLEALADKLDEKALANAILDYFKFSAKTTFPNAIKAVIRTYFKTLKENI